MNKAGRLRSFPLPAGERVAAQQPGEGGYAPKPAVKTKVLARNMRKQPTDAEGILWHELRNRQLNGYRFSRQVRVGTYIVDFACRQKRLVVELDGSQHAESRRDELRTRYLNQAGYAVLRSWNDEVVFERTAVLETILAILEGQITSSTGLRYVPTDMGGNELFGRSLFSPLPAGERVAAQQPGEGAFDVATPHVYSNPGKDDQP